jgi:hypothetical protein
MGMPKSLKSPRRWRLSERVKTEHRSAAVFLGSPKAKSLFLMMGPPIFRQTDSSAGGNASILGLGVPGS